MSMFDSMRISATGLSAERLRMDTIASNLANANTTRATDANGNYLVDANGDFVPYMRKEVLFQSSDVNNNPVMAGMGKGGDVPKMGVEPIGIVQDPSPARRVYDPTHPDSDADGYVSLPNINPVTEMIDMTTATRAYEANVTAMNASKNMALKALDLLR